MLEAVDETKPDTLSHMQTCNIKGRAGQFYLVKLCPRRARVVPTDMPNGPSFFVDKADLRNIDYPEPGLFPPVDDEISDAAVDRQRKTATQQAEMVSPPYGLFDLDPNIYTDPEPPFRVGCYVRGCTEMLRPPTRGFRGQTVPCTASGHTARAVRSPTLTQRPNGTSSFPRTLQAQTPRQSSQI